MRWKFEMECPYCKGTDQQAEDPFVDDDSIVKQRINCENCGKHYYFVYQKCDVVDKNFLPIKYPL